MINKLSLFIASALLLLSAVAAFATESRSSLAAYYASASGKSGEQLKTALQSILEKHTAINYGSGASNSTWWAFYVTDQAADGSVVNRYSPDVFRFGSRGAVVSGMNIEHSMPKSWWGGTKNNAYKDLFNLYPSPSADNSTKSNYPMAIVSTVEHDSGEGYDKVGYGTVNGSRQRCWEPGDGWKGDFARSYMYMAVCYGSLTWEGTGLQTMDNDDWRTLRSWARSLYLGWVACDSVADIEIARNNDVYSIQGNRNPFIDYPFLAQYLWGDSVGVAFNPAYAISTAADDDRYRTMTSNPAGGEDLSTIIYQADCISNFGNMEASDNDFGSGLEVWIQSSYGWKASAYYGGTAYAADATLRTPAISLTGYSKATLTFSHAVNFAASPSSVMSLSVECDGELFPIDVPNWPAGKNWTYVESGDIDLSQFAGKSIVLCFRYTSTTAEAATWEFKSLSVSAERATALPSECEPSDCQPDFNSPYELFSLSGTRLPVASPARGPVIVRQGGRSWLITVR